MLLAVIRGRAEAPGNLVWRDAWLPLNWRPDPYSATAAHNARRVALLAARDLQADALRTYRDPCPNCGVRADIGCKHQARGW